MPPGKLPQLPPDFEAELDAMLEDPCFQNYADTFMDMEFKGEGLTDATFDMETVDPAYLHQVRIALHNAALTLILPGEPFVQAYRIAREQIADQWMGDVLTKHLLDRYNKAVAVGDSEQAAFVFYAITDHPVIDQV